MSHTTTLKIKVQDGPHLKSALQRIGGQYIGNGSHRLYSSTESGVAFQLPGWTYPCILREDGTLAYDNYGGQWGDEAVLRTLIDAYAVEAARQAAEMQGWYVEDVEGGGLRIYHPDGGTLTVHPSGQIEADGFVGGGCMEASRSIEEALGQVSERVVKPACYDEFARIHALDE